MNWSIIESTEKEKDLILKKLQSFNKIKLDVASEKFYSIPLNYIVKYKDRVIGGINANIFFMQNNSTSKASSLHIEYLFVEAKYRYKRVGTALLNITEEKARNAGLTLAQVDSFDFQAKEFYIKNGYKIFATIEDFPGEYKLYYLKKVLSPSKLC